MTQNPLSSYLDARSVVRCVQQQRAHQYVTAALSWPNLDTHSLAGKKRWESVPEHLRSLVRAAVSAVKTLRDQRRLWRHDSDTAALRPRQWCYCASTDTVERGTRAVGTYAEALASLREARRQQRLAALRKRAPFELHGQRALQTLASKHGVRVTEDGCWTRYGYRVTSRFVADEDAERWVEVYEAHQHAAMQKRLARWERQNAPEAVAARELGLPVPKVRRSLRRHGTVALDRLRRARRARQQRVEAARLAEVGRRLGALGLDASLADRAEPVLGLLDEAAAQGHTVTRATVLALAYARDNETPAWRAYWDGEFNAAGLCRRVEAARHRHECTEYDGLLQQGYDRNLARDICRR
ncbi:MAG TPA: hypothetical protein VNO52_17180 [Methylomirabilota bacterium]|nr:hypothetical protein [Methylomirabilota bacterium]